MINFSSFVYYLEEAKRKKKVDGEEEEEGSKANSAGVLHELLTGYYLNGGKHMEKHEDINGLSPEEAHNMLQQKMKPEVYQEAHQRAKAAADDIRQRVGGKIKRIHWTSKPGDIKRSTGVESTQKEDPSDIMITTPDGQHHGISLKTSKSTEHVPIANPGIEALHGADHILKQHRDDIRASYPNIAAQTNSDGRKEVVRSSAKLEAEVREKNRATLSAMSVHLQKKLSALPPDELVHHLRENVLHAHATPLQEHGHNHIRHTIWGENGNYKTKGIDPSQHYEHILSSPEHITVETTGQGVTYSHKGVAFARQNVKFDSQADPLGSVKSATQDVPIKKPRAAPAVKTGRGKKLAAPAVPVPAAKPAPQSVARAPQPDPGGEDVAANEGMGGAIGSRGYSQLEHHMTSTTGGDKMFHTPAEQEMMKRGNG